MRKNSTIGNDLQQKMYFRSMNTIKLSFEDLGAEKTDVIAAMLTTANAQGFEHGENTLYAFFAEDDFDAERVAEILRPFEVQYKTEVIAPQNWNELWEQNFEPVIVYNEVGVRAHFHPPFNNVRYDIEITPKMSFGTGHHATTQLMLQYMCETEFTDKTVFDFGCGTGVLAIFASMKNAQSVMGTDNDEWSVTNAIENCARNHRTNIEISGEDIDSIDQKFDIILANINLNILIQYKMQLKDLLLPTGKLFLSGLMTSDRNNIIDQYQSAGFEVVSQKQQKEWIALELRLLQP